MDGLTDSTLAEVCTLVTDGTHDTPKRVVSGYPLIKAKEITGGRIDFETCDSISEEEHLEVIARSKPEFGDTLFAHIGASLGEAAFVNTTREFSIKNVALFKPNPAVIDARYLYYLVISPAFQALAKVTKTGSAQPFLGLSQLRGHCIRYHRDLATQRRIGAILSAYDGLVENSQRRIRFLEAMACALYREWFVHFCFPGNEKVPRVASPLGEIPQGWQAVPLASLVDFAKGRKPSETRKEALPGDVRLLLIDSLRGGRAEFTSPAKLVLAETRDTIMVMDGASSCEVAIGFAGAVGSTLGRFRTTCPQSFSPHALYRFLEAKAQEFKSKNIGAAIPHANKDYILTQLIALPSKAIGSSFHDQLEPIQCTVETLKAQIQNLRRTRDLLLPRLLSAQIETKKKESK